MKKDTQKANSGNLKKIYKAQVNKLPTNELRMTLKILYQNKELGLSTDQLDSLPVEKNEWVSKKTGKRSFLYSKNISDILQSLGVYNDGKISKTKALFLIEVIKSTLNLRATGKELPDDQTIIEIECFIARHSKNEYKIVINKDYEHPLEVSKSIGIWSMFLEMLQTGYLPFGVKNKQMFDYLNSNKNNLITTNTKYPLQGIIKQGDDGYLPKFKNAVYTEKVLVRRQNKLKESA